MDDPVDDECPPGLDVKFDYPTVGQTEGEFTITSTDDEEDPQQICFESTLDYQGDLYVCVWGGPLQEAGYRGYEIGSDNGQYCIDDSGVQYAISHFIIRCPGDACPEQPGQGQGRGGGQ